MKQLPFVELDNEVEGINFVTAAKADGGTIVAEQGDLVGCYSWTIIPTLHRGLIGRLTLLLVDREHRRQGIGTRKFDQTSYRFLRSFLK